MPFWEAWMSTESVFCKAVVKCGYLTEEQMQRAAERYRLGRSRDGGVIFWQIDEMGRTRDGKIMYYREDCHRDKSRHPSWASARLKAYYGPLPLRVASLRGGGRGSLCGGSGEDGGDYVGSLSTVCLDGGGRAECAVGREAPSATGP